MIFVTGDIHGSRDIQKLSASNFPMQPQLSREDFVIICGDFGLVWQDCAEERRWLNWLEEKPWTTLWVDGNHENFDRLHTYPATEWHGGKIQKITPHIFHLCRGQIFQLENRRIFTMGGAESRDKEYRRAGVSWWAEELPAETELQHAREALERVNWNVDVVISHCLSTKMQQKLFKEWNYPQNRLTDFFQELDEKLDFRLWFSGHYHPSKQCDPRHVILYDAIVQLTENGFQPQLPQEPDSLFTNI